MQTSKKQPIWLTYIVLLIVVIAAFWFSQHSINAYWDQTYHQESPLTKLGHYSWWRKGEELQYRAITRYQHLKQTLEEFRFIDEPLIAKDYSQDPTILLAQQSAIHALTPPKKAEPVEPTHTESAAPVATAEEEKNDELANGNLVYINSARGDKVFFAGDSLMQGVAPWVQKWLKSEHNVQSVNLSKQSTGLSYPSFFDWPKTIENTLESDRNIKVLIMFLGPNDPWDFAAPTKPRLWLKFKSPEWEQVYIQRIDRILAAARKHRVRVIWLGVPNMRSKKLNDQMHYLEQVYQTHLAHRVLFLPTESLLSNGQHKYMDSIHHDGKLVKVRSKDGIHFSAVGQKILAGYIQQHLVIK